MPLLIFMAGSKRTGGTKKGSGPAKGRKSGTGGNKGKTSTFGHRSLEEKLEYVKQLFKDGFIDKTEYDNRVSRLYLMESKRMSQTTVIRRKAAKPGMKKKRPDSKKKPGTTIRKQKPASKEALAEEKERKRRQAAARKKKKEREERARQQMLQDFEDELRRELGLTRDFKLKISFEEELRRISRKAKEESANQGGALERAMIQHTESGREYILPAVEIVEADFEKGTRIDEIFIMNQDGLLIRHFAFGSASRIDEDILASMITVVQNFISDSFGDSKTMLKELHMGEFNILIQQGEFVNSIAISSDSNLKSLEREIGEMLREIEMINIRLKDGWDGDLDDFLGIEECISKLTGGKY